MKDPVHQISLKHYLKDMTSSHTLIAMARPQSLLQNFPWNQIILEPELTRNILKGVFVDEYHLFAKFGTHLYNKFKLLGKYFLAKIFRPTEIMPSSYRLPSYLTMSATINEKVINNSE